MVTSEPLDYTLFIGLRSPFARRVRLAMERLRIRREERIINLFEETPELNCLNPLGLVPTLATRDAGVLHDSTLILEYLDEKTHGIWAKDSSARIQEKQASVLSVGLMQTAVNLFQETQMHEVPSNVWIRDHEETLKRTLLHLSRVIVPRFSRLGKLTQPAWDLAVALEYLNFRFPQKFQEIEHPEFLKVLVDTSNDTYFLKTRPIP